MKPPLSPDSFSEMAAETEMATTWESKSQKLYPMVLAKEAVAFQGNQKIRIEFAEWKAQRSRAEISQHLMEH